MDENRDGVVDIGEFIKWSFGSIVDKNRETPQCQEATARADTQKIVLRFHPGHPLFELGGRQTNVVVKVLGGRNTRVWIETDESWDARIQVKKGFSRYLTKYWHYFTRKHYIICYRKNKKEPPIVVLWNRKSIGFSTR